MKKLLFIAIAVLALTSCEKEDMCEGRHKGPKASIEQESSLTKKTATISSRFCDITIEFETIRGSSTMDTLLFNGTLVSQTLYSYTYIDDRGNVLYLGMDNNDRIDFFYIYDGNDREQTDIPTWTPTSGQTPIGASGARNYYYFSGDDGEALLYFYWNKC